MTAQLVDGTALSRQLRADAAARIAQLPHPPGLAVILVGEDPASAVYVRNKVKACAEHGLHSVFEKYEASFSEAELLARIDMLNADPAIHGILVQMPLPKHIDPQKVIARIATSKDVDGFSVLSAGELVSGLPGLRPCTPYGCMTLLKDTGQDLVGMHAVVIGQSNIVGRPMALELLMERCTVTICHSKTRDLPGLVRQADIVVAGVGKANFVKGDWIKPGAIVIDVGTNRNAEGKLCGDVDFAAAKEHASWITPVPGGVGPMTIATLLANTLRATELQDDASINTRR